MSHSRDKGWGHKSFKKMLAQKWQYIPFWWPYFADSTHSDCTEHQNIRLSATEPDLFLCSHSGLIELVLNDASLPSPMLASASAMPVFCLCFGWVWLYWRCQRHDWHYSWSQHFMTRNSLQPTALLSFTTNCTIASVIQPRLFCPQFSCWHF